MKWAVSGAVVLIIVGVCFGLYVHAQGEQAKRDADAQRLIHVRMRYDELRNLDKKYGGLDRLLKRQSDPEPRSQLERELRDTRYAREDASAKEEWREEVKRIDAKYPDLEPTPLP